MLTQEKIANFNVIIANNGTPAPEDAADFEIYKAMVNSQALAGNTANVANAAAIPQTNPNMMAVPNPIPAPVAQLQPQPNQNPIPATVPQTVPSSIPSAIPSNGSHYTMDDLMSNSMAVDKYLRVKYQQVFIGDDVTNGDTLYVSINMDNVVYKMSIKGGNPVSYASTLDGKTCTTGGSWMDAVADIQKKDPKAKPYNCADIPMTVVLPVKSPAGMLLADAGAILGHTTSTTNWKEWVSFYQSLADKTGTVLVKISHKDLNKNNNKWSILTFTAVNEDEAKALGINL